MIQVISRLENIRKQFPTVKISHLWSGRRRLSVGGRRGFRSGVSSFSSMAKVEKP